MACRVVLGSGIAFAQADIEQCFVDRTNAERVQRGLGAMAVNQDLVAMARRQSQRMADAGTIFHNQNLAADGPRGWKLLGENVGVGPSCDSLHQAFMNSEHHRDNILEPRFNYVGMGVVRSGGSTIYITEQFMQAGAVAGSAALRAPAPKPSPSPSPKPSVVPAVKPTAPQPAPPPRTTRPPQAPSPRPSPQPSPAASPSAAPSPSSPPSLPVSPRVRAAPGATPAGPSPIVPVLLGGLAILVVAGAGAARALTRRRSR